MAQHEAAIPHVNLDQIVDRSPGQRLHQPVGIVVAAHQVLTPRQRGKGRLRGHASRLGLAGRKIADDPQVVLGTDHPCAGDHRGIHRTGRGEGPIEELPHRVIGEMGVGGEEMGHARTSRLQRGQYRGAAREAKAPRFQRYVRK